MIKKTALSLIRFYQMFLSFDTGILRVLTPNGACKNSPSCSEYTYQMIDKYGVIKGSVMGAKRIWSCR